MENYPRRKARSAGKNDEPQRDRVSGWKDNKDLKNVFFFPFLSSFSFPSWHRNSGIEGGGAVREHAAQNTAAGSPMVPEGPWQRKRDTRDNRGMP